MKQFIQKILRENLLNEALMNIDIDVNYIYDTFFRKDYEEIARTGKLTNDMFQISETNTVVLKSELGKKAHEVNMCIIYINKNTNWYNPETRIISIAAPIGAINFIKNESKDMSIEDAASQIDNGNSLRREFHESTIKGSIHHELVHWIDDSLHNRHIKNALININKKNVNKRAEFQNSVGSTDFEIQSQIHAIYQLKQKYPEEWDNMTFSSMLALSPSLFGVNKLLKGEKNIMWRKNILNRMNREGLLGRLMKYN